MPEQAPTLVDCVNLSRLVQTQLAFDSVAAIYDGPRGNNALIQRMRELSWRLTSRYLAAGSRLIDIGCGTGIDAEHFARAGYEVLATDWSPQMVARAQARAAQSGLQHRLRTQCIGAQELQRIDGVFDGAYSNFGPLNCVPDLTAVSRQCSRLLAPGGHLIFSVIGRICPWELAYYLLRLRPRRALVRFARRMTAVSLNQHTVWSRYYTPREFYRRFENEFELLQFRALNLFLPPPYLVGFFQRAPRFNRALAWADDNLGAWPVLRSAGDHFLMILRRR